MYSEISRYTSQIFYIARNKITHLIDTDLLTDEQKQEITAKQIDMYRVISNPFYMTENEQIKKSGKRTTQEYLNANQTSRPMEYALKSVTAGGKEPGKEIVENVKFINHQFDNIIQAIRDY